MDFTNFQYNFFRGLLFLFAASLIFILIVIATDGFQTSENNDIGFSDNINTVENKTEVTGFFNILNSVNDPANKTEVIDLVSSPFVRLLMGTIIMLCTFISYFQFKQFEKHYAVLIFGLIIGLSNSIIFNMLCFYLSNQWCFQFAFENLLISLTAGLIPAVILFLFHNCKNFLNSAPEFDIPIKEYMMLKFKFNLFSWNLATLQNWVIINLSAAGFILLLLKTFNN